MEIVEAHSYRVEQNRLYLPSLGPSPIQVPFGVGLGIRRRIHGPSGVIGSRLIRPRLRLRMSGTEVAALHAETDTAWVPLLPAFSRYIVGHRAGAPALHIQMAASEEERLGALGVVQRAHYLDTRDGGVVLLARLEKSRESDNIRARWLRGLSSEEERTQYRALEKVTGGVGDIVGALYLERLMHGYPLGRNAIYQHLGRRPPDRRAKKRRGFRWKVVSELGLYWISRVAVDAPFQGLGIGSVLCDAAREVASTRMLEQGDYIELIRRMPTTDFDAISAGKADFLTGRSRTFSVELPFTLRRPFLSRKPPLIWNAARRRWDRRPPGDSTQPARDCLAYYYAQTGPMVIGARPPRRARKGARE